MSNTNEPKFVFWEAFYDYAKQIPKRYRLQFFEAIIELGLYETPLSLEEIPASVKPVYQIAALAVEKTLAVSRKRYNACVNNGKKGGRPVRKDGVSGSKNQSKNQRQNQSKTKEIPDENQTQTLRETLEEKRGIPLKGNTFSYSSSTSEAVKPPPPPNPSGASAEDIRELADKLLGGAKPKYIPSPEREAENRAKLAAYIAEQDNAKGAEVIETS